MNGEEIVWNTISQSFDRTRRRPWSEVIGFIDSLSPDSKFLDVGCGNGRHLIHAAKKLREVVGVDFSEELLKIVRKRIDEEKFENVSLIQANAISLPFQEGEFDAAIFVAALHNIKGKENRLEALNEVYRIMRPNSKVLVSVWSRWQDRFRNYFLKDAFKYPFKRIKGFFTKDSSHEFGDITLPWKADNMNVPRFYHLYSKRELLNDVEHCRFKIESLNSVRIRSKHHPDNYFITLRK
ncbi:MAG TPA: class I SAM-dependent methyltransferase [Thermoplasmata archaeon]|nr:class I SAM-dependent methyltransferase [Thermoplasmata archaeon]